MKREVEEQGGGIEGAKGARRKERESKRREKTQSAQ